MSSPQQPYLDYLAPLLDANSAGQWGLRTSIDGFDTRVIALLLAERFPETKLVSLGVCYELLPEAGRGGGVGNIYAIAVPDPGSTWEGLPGYAVFDVEGSTGELAVIGAFTHEQQCEITSRPRTWSTLEVYLTEEALRHPLVQETIGEGRAMLQGCALEASVPSPAIPRQTRRI